MLCYIVFRILFRFSYCKDLKNFFICEVERQRERHTHKHKDIFHLWAVYHSEAVPSQELGAPSRPAMYVGVTLVLEPMLVFLRVWVRGS